MVLCEDARVCLVNGCDYECGPGSELPAALLGVVVYGYLGRSDIWRALGRWGVGPPSAVRPAPPWVWDSGGPRTGWPTCLLCPAGVIGVSVFVCCLRPVAWFSVGQQGLTLLYTKWQPQHTHITGMSTPYL